MNTEQAKCYIADASKGRFDENVYIREQDQGKVFAVKGNIRGYFATYTDDISREVKVDATLFNMTVEQACSIAETLASFDKCNGSKK